MNVNELTIINKYALAHHIKLDYHKLVQYQREVINLIIQKIEEDNQNLRVLLVFLSWELDHLNWKEKFSHLKDEEEFNVREYLIDKILNAPSTKAAEKILSYFCSVEDLEFFTTVEEWKTYVESITEDMNNNAFSNVLSVLKNITDHRCELIKYVMQYSQDKKFEAKAMSEYIDDNILSKHLEQIVCLLNLGYPMEEITNFFNKWNIDTKISSFLSIEKINDNYQNVVDYLKKTKSSLEERKDLIQIFNRSCVTEYIKIVHFLGKIDPQIDNELFKRVLKFKKLDHPTMKRYYTHILFSKIESSGKRESLFKLLDEGVISNNINNGNTVLDIPKLLEISDQCDHRTDEITDFIINLPIPQIINKIIITEENYDTRKTIYTEFPKSCKTGPFTEEEINYYSKWLEELCTLPNDICKKIMKIFKLPVVKELSVQDQMKLKTKLLMQENIAGLDYAYRKHLQKENEKDMGLPVLDNSVHLMTVAELLNKGVAIERVLEGFSEDDEITSNTIIRSPKIR